MLANIQEEKKNMNPNILFLRSSIQNIGLLNAKKKICIISTSFFAYYMGAIYTIKTVLFSYGSAPVTTGC